MPNETKMSHALEWRGLGNFYIDGEAARVAMSERVRANQSAAGNK